MRLQHILRTGVAFAILCLSACGGGSDDGDAGGGNAPGSGIGSAGGTVTGPAGAQVVVPASALSQNTAIAITQSASGAPALPSGVTAVGQMFAFTPHGTTFASPATVTVPFEPSQVPAGSTATLYKTSSAQTAWEVVAGATVNGNTMVGQVTSFSHLVVGTDPPVQVVDEPARYWQFRRYDAQARPFPLKGNFGPSLREFDGPPAPPGVLHETETFGLLTFALPGGDQNASGEVYSSTSGKTYWVEVEAPIGDPQATDEERTIGSGAQLVQRQSYQKNAQDATLELVITDARIAVADLNGTAPRLVSCPWATGSATCLDELRGELGMSVKLLKGRQGDAAPTRDTYHSLNGSVVLVGAHNNFRERVYSLYDFNDLLGEQDLGPPSGPLWNTSHFARTDENSITEIALKETLRVPVDLSAVPVCDPKDPENCQEFTLDIKVTAYANNRRMGESYVMARLRDPINVGGITLNYTGLTPTNRPILGSYVTTPAPPPVCEVGSNPDAGTLQFSSTSYLAPEFGGQVPVFFVTRTGGTSGEVSATFSTEGGSAIAGSHYTAVTRTIVFGDGDDVPRSISVPLIDNDDEDGDRTIELTLSADPECATLGTPASAVLTIIDDEHRPEPTLTYTVGGVVSGLAGTGLVLEEITTGARVTPTSNGTFAFSYQYQAAASYEVRVITHPTNPAQICTVGNATGTIASANVTNVAVTCINAAVTGSLDNAFGAGGKVTTGLAGGARAVALQSDGKILALGKNLLARYNSDGSIDTTWGTSGEIAVVFGGGAGDEATALALQADGRIIVAGFAQNGTTGSGLFNYDFALVRYDANGSVDQTFGTNGRIYTDFGSNNTDRAYAVLVQPNGAIVAAGHATATSGTGTLFAVARYDSTGSLDGSFGAGGKQTASIAGTDFGYAAALQADGSIVVAGRVAPDGTSPADVGVARFTSGGALDAGFGTNGTVRIDYTASGNPDQANAVAVQPDGRILLAGFLTSASNDFLLARLDAQGNRDTTFGAQGLASADFAAQQDVAYAVAVQSDGRILVAGSAYIGTSVVSDIGVARYLDTGAPDASFGNGGKLNVDFFAGADDAKGLAIQPDGGILVGGSARNGSTTGIGLIRVVP